MTKAYILTVIVIDHDAVTDALEAAGVSPAVGGEADAVTELARRANQPLLRAAQETT